MSKPPIQQPQYSAAAVATALIAAAGIKTAAARQVGCSVDTIERYIAKYPTVKAAYETGRNRICDAAESVVVKHITEQNSLEAAKFVLTTIGRERGWGQRTEHEITGKDGGPVAFTFRIVNDGRDSELDDGDVRAPKALPPATAGDL